MFFWIGFKKKEILFDRGDRVVGKSSFNFASLFNLGIDGITSFTTAPLRMSTILGFIISLGAFLMMMFFLLKRLIFGVPVQGFSALIVVILFLGGIQLLSLGIIGEYIGRIFNETKNRPVYLVNTYQGREKN
jgi:glycosyltransferase involved in cell wall biosynthesis